MLGRTRQYGGRIFRRSPSNGQIRELQIHFSLM